MNQLNEKQLAAVRQRELSAALQHKVMEMDARGKLLQLAAEILYKGDGGVTPEGVVAAAKTLMEFIKNG